MRVLLISQVPLNLERFRKTNQIFPQEQAQASWLKAIKQLGHSVEVFLYSEPILIPRYINTRIHTFLYVNLPRVYTKYRLFKNRYYYLQPENYLKSLKLVIKINSIKPDTIILSGGISELVSFPLLTAKKRKIKILLLHGVNPLEGATSFEKKNVKLFDWIVTNDPSHAQEWKKLGAKHATAVPYAGIDPDINHKVKLTLVQSQRFKSDLVFIGTLFPDRQKLFCELIKIPLDFKIWGTLPYGVSLNPKLQNIYQGDAWGRKAVLIYNATKIALNPVPPHMPIGGNMRTFEIPGSGAFQLTNRCPSIWYQTNKEVVIYNNFTDLKNKITLYLNDNKQRKNIAQAAFTKTHRKHTYRQRFRYIFNL